jgi:hypothetical protein
MKHSKTLLESRHEKTYETEIMISKQQVSRRMWQRECTGAMQLDAVFATYTQSFSACKQTVC